MSLPTSEEPLDATGPQLLRTETAQSLSNLGISENPPPLGFNYPDVGRETQPVFPKEYTLETSTGLVPEEVLQHIRSRASSATML